MNLKEIREGDLKTVFDALETAFTATGTNFYIIGALARDVWYSRRNRSFRKTKDVDFAILVGSTKEYKKIRRHLKEHNHFEDSKENAFVMLAPGGIEIDLLPFGEIEIDDGIHLTGMGLTSIKVNGFNEVYVAGTVEMQLETGHHFKIATLPSIIMLKLIAFDDRPEHRIKDAADIANIINCFFDLQADFIYTNHVDLFVEENRPLSLEEISSVVIGREIKKICSSNESLLERVKKILKDHFERAEGSMFVRSMVNAVRKDVEECTGWLKHILSSLTT